MIDGVFVLGAGRAGRSLARAFAASGVRVAALHGRLASDERDLEVHAGPLPPDLGGARTVVVTVRDDQLDAALGEIADLDGVRELVVLHASGSADPAALGRLRSLGHACGTFHPLVPLADETRAPALLRGAWFGVDGDERAMEAATSLAGALGARTLRIPPGEKGRYHAAAVLSANFPTVLAALAERLLAHAGVETIAARAAVRSLMRAAVGNLEGAEPADALTGPIRRGDLSAVQRHLAALDGDVDAGSVYVTLSVAAIALAREAGTDSASLDRIGGELASFAATQLPDA